MVIKSIRTAIMLLSLVFIVLIALMVLFHAVQEHRSLYARYVQGDLNALTDNMASDLVEVLASQNQFFELKAHLLSLDPYDHVINAAVYDPSWQLLDSYVGRAGMQNTAPVIDLRHWNERREGVFQKAGYLVAVKRIGDPDLVMGYLVVINDYQGPLDVSTLNLALQALPSTLISILILMALFYLLGSRWLSPLTRLSDFAREVQRTKDYSLKIPVTGQYEISALAKNINNMMDAIRQESEINQEYTTLLEERREEMEFLANYDSLTGLVNRQYFLQLLDEALHISQQNGHHVALMFIDLDGFKVVNDSLGHEVGDRLLEQVAARLKEFSSSGDIISRHGGDEFLIMIPECDDMEALENRAGQVVTALMQKYQIHSWELRVTASIGISTSLTSPSDVRELIRNADVAMYDAKSAGKSRYSFFNGTMLDGYQRRLDIANSIDQALEDNEFEIFYQAKVSPYSEPLGAEALIRWNSQALGFVSPAEFIPIAEQSGKITDITQWVINRVCSDYAVIKPLVSHSFSISINLSAHDLKKYYLVGFIRGAFIKFNIPPGAIEFEVTEYAYLDNLNVASEFFREIASMGCNVALDDFGTGYSSLSYLTKIPIDIIKVDKQFVDSIGNSERDDALVVTIMEMARRLGMKLCAEGVEDQQQVNFLTAHGCDIFQGYYFCKPKPLEEFCQWITDMHPDAESNGW
ncbi:MAG: GGDEF domain-containing protein [Oceanospirillaceae bacterium]|nr:GGDEF domain-containing protein [Oceanospirillaceae bacterium]MBT12186.1 GGDEF domain-containing protein [Oceanospirillaceae bacterium]|tara:strand:- start:75092 stop:77173 length:2082 start_codon:yes stop_codon:yes gene_type:complete